MIDRVQVIRAAVVSFLSFIVALALSESAYNNGPIAYIWMISLFLIAGTCIGQSSIRSRVIFVISCFISSGLWLSILFYFSSLTN